MGDSRVHPGLELIRRRFTTEEFDPSRRVDERTIRLLVDDARRAPSSFNIQHWRFLAVRDPQGLASLQEAAFGQTQVGRASVVFVMLGDLRGVERLPRILDDAVASGALPRRKADAWIRMAGEIYADPAGARDEAIRSVSLAAMVMMLAAEARGLATGALTGFDPERVRAAFDIEPRYLPVMLLAIGHPGPQPKARMPRMPVDELLALDRWTGDGR